jgi:quercetin dioxygenase-like cupin family protein
MRDRTMLFALALAGLFVFGLSNAAAQKSTTKAPTIWPASDLKWTEIPNTGGVKYSALWGDPMKGAHGSLYKFPAGAKFPLHFHTSGMKVVIVSGMWSYTPEGGTEHLLGPGSYLAFGPKDRHLSGTPDGSECTFFIEQTGQFDMIPVEAPKK